MKIPERLDHLRRDRRGLPVPFVNRWGPEDVDRLTIDWDTHCGHWGVFLDDTSEVVPDFTRQHQGRQRECVTRGLCQVCARPVSYKHRMLPVGGVSAQTILIKGEPTTVITEPWLCAWCADFAASTCPALIRRTRSDDLVMVAIRSSYDFQIVFSNGWVDGPLESYSRQVLPVLWAKILLTKDKVPR